ALTYAASGHEDYIIIVRFDDTPLSDISPHVAYIDARVKGPTVVAHQLAAKLGRARPTRGATSPKVVVALSDAGYLDVDLFVTSINDYFNNDDNLRDSVELEVRLPTYVSEWKLFAETWIRQNRNKMIKNGNAAEEAFTQVSSVLNLADAQCHQ